jgi:DNA repair protein RadD
MSTDSPAASVQATSLTLRPYQARCVGAARKLVAAGRRSLCIVAPTGSGKTVIGVAIAASALQRNGRVLWIAHRRELLDQTLASLTRAGVHHVSVLRADDDRYDPSAPVVLASIQTLVARGDRPPARVVIPDECHHFVRNVWGAVAGSYSESFIVGLTATPERADGSPLGDIFDGLVVAATYSELIDAGHLVPCEIIRPPQRLSGEIAQDPANAYVQYGGGRPAVIFCGSVPFAHDVARRLPRAAVVDGTTAERLRDERLAAFASGDIDVLTNCFVLTEGWDAPRAKVCVLARGCAHASTYMQIGGRILRPYPGETAALLIDLTGASLAHGFPTEDRDYSLEGRAIKRKASPGDWVCPKCDHVQRAIPASRECPACGYRLPAPSLPEVVNAPMRAVVAWACASCGHEHGYMPVSCALCGTLSPRGTRVNRDTSDDKAEYLRKMREIAAAKGYKAGWVAHKYRGKYGCFPWENEVQS